MLDQLKGWFDVIVNAAPENRIYVLLIAIVFTLIITGGTVSSILISKLDSANSRIEVLVESRVNDNKSYYQGQLDERKRNDSICEEKIKDINDKYERLRIEKDQARDEELSDLKKEAKQLRNETRRIQNRIK